MSAPVSESAATLPESIASPPTSGLFTSPLMMSLELTVFFPGSATAVPVNARKTATYPTALLRRCPLTLARAPSRPLI
jgi:hypothetical protein